MVSRNKNPLVLACCAFIAFLISSAQLSAGDWPQFRGPNLTGSAAESEVFSANGVGLEIAWKRELGSGYSSISVVGDRAVTMYVDGDADIVAAFDAATGDKIWEYRVGSRYEGHSGSDDGPAGTPAIDDGRVFGLGRVGHLFAVSLEDGSELWSRDLKLGSEATLPHYGFATTPLVVGDIVVVQTGAPEGRAISAYDTKSGQPRWSVDDDTVNYQSPAVIELGSLVQIVALNSKFLIGIDPSDGDVLWRYDHETNPAEAFNLPLALGDDRILINSLSEVVAIKIDRDGDEFSISEIWRSNVFRSSYSIPVALNGYLYGFSGQFLSCVDGANGEVMWKSRPPGGKGLILVDGHL
jgi:outer membrane protein assembly factor BamB